MCSTVTVVTPTNPRQIIAVSLDSLRKGPQHKDTFTGRHHL